MGIPSMTYKQAKFAETLVDQLGYKDSPHKDIFLQKIGFHSASIEYASTLIDGLLKENRRRKFFTRKTIDENEVPTVSDLSQFVFCPASYSIKRSLISIKDEDTPLPDTDESAESFFLLRLKTLKCPVDKIKEEAREHFLKIYPEQIEDFKPFLDSKLIYYGYGDKGSPYRHNKDHNLSGRPHLIFEDGAGKRTLIVEKISYKKIIPDIVWENNLVQATAYIHLFKELKCSDALIVYWKASVDGKWASDRKYKMFNIQLTENKIATLLDQLTSFKKLLEHKEIEFESSSVNPEKCFHCSCRSLCNHKSGLINNLLFPYSTPEYDKKYPLYYTWKEEMELMAKESQEMFRDIQESMDLDKLLKDEKNKKKDEDGLTL
jgi:CRISPR/Cas system-associated exonuclease Cas4 (RecB family)